MDHIVQIVLSYIQLHKEAMLAIAVPGGAFVSIGIQWFLHHFKIDGKRLSFTISHIFVLATAAAAYFLDSVHPNVGVTYGWLWVAAQFWHQFAINPAYNRYVLPFLAWLAKQPAKPAAPAAAEPAPDSALE